MDRLGGFAAVGGHLGRRTAREIAPHQVRARILVADNEADLFAGPLRDVVAGPPETRRRRPSPGASARPSARRRRRRHCRTGSTRRRRAGPQPLRRSAAAGPAGPGAARRPGGAAGRRTDLGGGRAHRGGHRRPAAYAPGPAAPPSSPPPRRCCWTGRTPCTTWSTAGSPPPARTATCFATSPDTGPWSLAARTTTGTRTTGRRSPAVRGGCSMTTHLPVAEPRRSRRAARPADPGRRPAFAAVLALNALAAAAGLGGPWLLGRIIDAGPGAAAATRHGGPARRSPSWCVRRGADAAGPLRPLRGLPLRRAHRGARPRAVRRPGARAARRRWWSGPAPAT